MSYTPCEKCGKLCQKVWCERCEDFEDALDFLEEDMWFYENNVVIPEANHRYNRIKELLIKYGKEWS